MIFELKFPINGQTLLNKVCLIFNEIITKKMHDIE